MLGAIALAAISTFGTVKNEIETGHTMLGKIVTAYPRWADGRLARRGTPIGPVARTRDGRDARRPSLDDGHFAS